LHFYNEKEMIDLDNKFRNLMIDYSKERIETEDRKEEYSMIYEIYILQ